MKKSHKNLKKVSIATKKDPFGWGIFLAPKTESILFLSDLLRHGLKKAQQSLSSDNKASLVLHIRFVPFTPPKKMNIKNAGKKNTIISIEKHSPAWNRVRHSRIPCVEFNLIHLQIVRVNGKGQLKAGRTFHETIPVRDLLRGRQLFTLAFTRWLVLFYCPGWCPTPSGSKNSLLNLRYIEIGRNNICLSL